MPAEELASHQVIPQPVAQSIFYTAYKSESEIRYELGLYGSVLDSIEDQLFFPSPPTLGLTPTNDNPSGDEAPTWYFYLSDIAARHLINRIISVGVNDGGYGTAPEGAQIQALLRDYRIFMGQLEDWYCSLPAQISFQKPTLNNPVTMCTSYFTMILRARYLSMHELLCRPFVRICLNYHLDLPESQVDEVVSIASMGLQDCVWKLHSSINPVWRHQGAWIGVRSGTACSMMLIGAARSSRLPELNAASRLWLPENWHEVITSFLDRTAVFANETRGGIRDCLDLLRRALADFPEELQIPST